MAEEAKMIAIVTNIVSRVIVMRTSEYNSSVRPHLSITCILCEDGIRSETSEPALKETGIRMS